MCARGCRDLSRLKASCAGMPTRIPTTSGSTAPFPAAADVGLAFDCAVTPPAIARSANRATTNHRVHCDFATVPPPMNPVLTKASKTRFCLLGFLQVRLARLLCEITLPGNVSLRGSPGQRPINHFRNAGLNDRGGVERDVDSDYRITPRRTRMLVYVGITDRHYCLRIRLLAETLPDSSETGESRFRRQGNASPTLVKYPE